MTRTAIAALATSFTLAAALAGCMDQAQDADIAAVESDITNITPFTGGWTYTSLSPVSTTCSVPASIAHGESGPFGLGSVTTSSFRITPQDGLPAFTCSYSGGVFQCPNRITATLDLRPAFDLAVTVKITATGVMSDSKHAQGKQDAFVSCVGTKCNLLGQMPCGFVDNFTVMAP
jgi:hypothetical protein